MRLPAIRSLSIRHTVADAIRQALREGRFSPGEDINEVALAGEFQISRGPLREALLVLSEEGLLTHSTNRGFSVLRFTREDRAQIDTVRLLLETQALELARERMNASDLEHVAVLLAELMAQVNKGTAAVRDAAEMAFHSFIWKCSGNPWLVSSLTRIMLPYFIYSRPFGLIATPTASAVLAQHQLYVDFLTRKTGLTATECVKFHLGQK